MGELPLVQLLVAAAYPPRRGSFLPLAMAGEGLEPGAQLALKGAVLELLVSHPGGIPLQNFGVLFYQHHSRRLDLAQHGYLSLRHLLGDMKELVALDEEGEETKARCRHLACNPLLEAKHPRRRHRRRRSRKEVPPKGQPSEAANTAPRLWNSCHHLATAAPPSHPPAATVPEHQAGAPLPRATSLSHFPNFPLPGDTHNQLPLLTHSSQPLWGAYQEAHWSSPMLAPSWLSPPASPPLGSPTAKRAELEQNVAQVLQGYPGGVSLFHFRQAYGATYSHPFPLDGTASVKEQLVAMPGTVRVEGWGVQTMLYPACPQELPGTSKETAPSPSPPEAASPAAVCISPSISASPTEATLAPEGSEPPPVPRHPPPDPRGAPGSPAELLLSPTAPAAARPPETGLEHQAMGHIPEETVVMEGVATATPVAGTVPSELAAELPLPLAQAPSASLSPAGSPCAPTPPLRLGHVAVSDAVLYGLNSATSPPSPEPSLPGPASVLQPPQPLTTVVSPGPAWPPMQGVSGAVPFPREIPPFRPMSLALPSLATPYKQWETGRALWGANKPEPPLLPIPPPQTSFMWSKRKPSKHKADSCVLL